MKNVVLKRILSLDENALDKWRADVVPISDNKVCLKTDKATIIVSRNVDTDMYNVTIQNTKTWSKSTDLYYDQLVDKISEEIVAA